jgi:tricorn protease-like protein
MTRQLQFGPPFVALLAVVLGPSSLRAQEAKERASLRGHTNEVVSLAISADGKTLASGSKDRTIRLWDLPTGKERAVLRGHAACVDALAIAADGKTLASGSKDGTITLWDLATGKQRASFKGHEFDDLSLAITADGRTLISGSDQVKTWDVDTGKQRAGPRTGPVRALTVTPDGKTMAAAGTNRSLAVWDLAAVKVRATIIGLNGYPLSVSLAPDGKTLAVGGTNGALQLWDVVTGKERATLKGHAFHVRSVAFGPDGTTLAGGGGQDGPRGGQELTLWDLTTGRVRETFRGDGEVVWAVAFTPDGKTLAAADGPDTRIRLWALNGPGRAGDLPAARLSDKELEASWDSMAGADAARAYRAMWALAGTPGQALPLLRNRLQPVAAPDSKRLAQLIAGLDSDEFDVREQCTRELKELDESARPGLRKLLGERPSAEARQRAEQLLADLDQPANFPQRLRFLRAIEALEHIGSTDARQLLEKLAGGLPEAQVTREAAACLRRMSRAGLTVSPRSR